MSVTPSTTNQLALGAPLPPYTVGDFARSNHRKYDLEWCPLCHFDAEREPHRFDIGDSAERRAAHFFEAHGPEDCGRPMAELLPGGGR